MQTSQWNTEIIIIFVIAAIISLVIGYLVSSIIHGRKVACLEILLKQNKQELDENADSLLESQSQNQSYQLTEVRLMEKLESAQDTNLRLSGELAACEGELKSLQAIIDKLKEDIIAEGKQVKVLETLEKEGREKLIEIKNNLSEQEGNYQELQQSYQSLNNEHIELKTNLDRKEEHFKEQVIQFTETKKSLTKEFERLANKIFEERGKDFTNTSKVSIDALLTPFREQIEGFQNRINEVHDSSVRANSSLSTEINNVLKIGLTMSKDANNLTSALKGDSQQRGAWGESQLHRTLEMSGLVKDVHFDVQSSFRDAEGKQKQTDFLIKLPGNKHIIIDSKVSLVAYDQAISAKTTEDYQLAIIGHVKAVRKHIDELAAKDYTNVLGIHSPNFVLMFMPIEPAYIEALKNNKDLFEYGYKKGIVLVSHTTLLPILRTVSNLWMLEQSNTEMREISDKAGEIFNQVSLVAERLNKLGNTLDSISTHYNRTVTALAGKQGLYGKVERFSQLSTKVSKSLPPLKPINKDFNTEQLSIIVESIDNSEKPQDSSKT